MEEATTTQPGTCRRHHPARRHLTSPRRRRTVKPAPIWIPACGRSTNPA